MSEEQISPKEKKVRAEAEKAAKAKPANDDMNIPVPDAAITPPPSETEAALIKQAENPLGDPDKK
ncbi:hypothetical protein KXD93_27125 [Mucilaginibacter sp. BJC16-A38]|uniref:hypothetical protein n=1 Tax=Mucilaginibacter phenanthrenivorans TaxID=1234842 RepID=UPI0021570A8C|nr:hypothetical protein [Mucilaginibacter phenanthrenivorans]MCR8561355.1 hypothetical protein [Mucilaginibacter phenanthrenivorans]